MCGPARAYRLGLLVAENYPERFVTLSRVSLDVREAYKALRRLSRLIRRRGYTWEYLAVPERHKNGSWHLHLLQKGSSIPVRELSALAEKAGMGRVVWINAVQYTEEGVSKAPKYLVKYMTKDAEKFPPNVNRYAQSRGFWPGGRKNYERLVWGPSNADWDLVALGSAEIRGDDGSILWRSSLKGGD